MRRILLLACLTLAASLLHAGELKVSGTVTNADGKPVANADVSGWWSNWKGKLAPDGGTKSKDDGTFALTVDMDGRIPPTILAYDADRKTGAILTLTKEPEQKITLKLIPLATVHAHFDCPEMGQPFDGTIEGAMKLGDSPFMQCGSETKDAALLLPAGQYVFENTSTDTI